jgi:outer membrane protein assembly factor BamE (lipoprotein component of BamABCDE complex)
MVRETYWKVWIVVLLTLGVLRLLTASFQTASPTSNVQPTQTPSVSQHPRPAVQVPQDNNQQKPKIKSEAAPITLNSPALKAAVTRDAAIAPIPASEKKSNSEVTNGQPTQIVTTPQSSNAADAPTDNSMNREVESKPNVNAPRSQSFTLNSTKEEVLRTQGTPTKLNDYEWSYGLSTVQFRNDRVISWNIFATNPLHVKMTPSSTASSPPGYFTVGSTKDEVLAVQGTPTKVGDYQWGYGLSIVEFRNDRVVSWNIFTTNPLLVKMVSSITPNPAGYFTVGSTKDEVLAVQGTPTRLGDYQWAYGLSTVEFRNDRVVSWNIFATNRLHLKMIHSSIVPDGYFTVGSTKDEVLAVQGTPTKIGDYQWGYGLSTVEFRNDRVVSWNIFATNPLRTKMVSSIAPNPYGYFTVGSTKDEVLAVQGTPTKVGDYQWGYGLSTVEFRNDRVVSWTVRNSRLNAK